MTYEAQVQDVLRERWRAMIATLTEEGLELSDIISTMFETAMAGRLMLTGPGQLAVDLQAGARRAHELAKKFGEAPHNAATAH